MALINQNPAFGPQSRAVREFPVVESSLLQNVHYDPNTLQCVVTLKGGSQYVYNMIFPMVVDQWMQAPSKGQFFVKNIRGKYAMKYRMINKTVGPRGGQNGRASGTGCSEYVRGYQSRGRGVLINTCKK